MLPATRALRDVGNRDLYWRLVFQLPLPVRDNVLEVEVNETSYYVYVRFIVGNKIVTVSEPQDQFPSEALLGKMLVASD